MILFFGTRQRRSVRGTGAFRCPFCLEVRGYEHVEARTWIHVFWVPLVPLGGRHESVRCTVCGGEWAPAVLAGNDLG